MDFRWPASRSEIERIQRERKRLAVELALRAPFFQSRLARHRSRPPRRSRGLEQNSAADQGRAARAPAGEIPRRVLHPAAHPRRSNTGARAASPAGRCSIRARPTTWTYGIAGLPRAPGRWSARPPRTACTSRSRSASIRSAHLYARAAEDLRHRHGLVRLGHQHALGHAARADPTSSSRRSGPAWRATGCTSPTSPRRRASISQTARCSKIIVAAEPLSPAKRQKLERMPGAPRCSTTSA